MPIGPRNSSRRISPGWIGAKSGMATLRVIGSVVIDDLDIFRGVFRPAKADAPLVVDADAVLPLTVMLKRFKPVGRGNAKVVEPVGGGDQVEFPFRNPLNVLGQAPGKFSVPDLPRLGVPEAPAHGSRYV